MSIDKSRALPQVLEIGKSYSESEYTEALKKSKWIRMDYLCELLRNGNEEDAAEMIIYYIGNSHTHKEELNQQTALLLT